ncbi:GNAT family N-acetyltransferase [Streptococcus gallolyticus]|uniref:GNAT family N-acetyltransferase n=1 Tax=Streptococcus hepaticus TaxID=3349163 RepID=UPI001C963F9A|nr:GNAT family N-acetyltransferase [Streptococcus gallolyticus]MBY5041164.1 GNAT family N-acetyltransferase [Streptococcus gallolyticus]
MIKDNQVRLRPYQAGEDLLFALPWYQDVEMVYLVDGVKEAYTEEKLLRMYHYLANHGQLYFIEIVENGHWRAIGDVTLSEEDLPIVIGEAAYRGQGLGSQVLALMIEEAQAKGWTELHVREIYDYNLASKKCFEAYGFVPEKKTEKGWSYRLKLSNFLAK